MQTGPGRLIRSIFTSDHQDFDCFGINLLTEADLVSGVFLITPAFDTKDLVAFLVFEVIIEEVNTFFPLFEEQGIAIFFVLEDFPIEFELPLVFFFHLVQIISGEARGTLAHHPDSSHFKGLDSEKHQQTIVLFPFEEHNMAGVQAEELQFKPLVGIFFLLPGSAFFPCLRVAVETQDSICSILDSVLDAKVRPRPQVLDAILSPFLLGHRPRHGLDRL